MTEEAFETEPGSVFLGWVERAHGLKGGMVIRVFTSGDMPGIPAGTRLLLEGSGDLTVKRSTPRDPETILLQALEIRSREDADSARGRRIFIDRSEADARLPFFPLYGFVGMTVVSGEKSYEVVDIEALTGNPLLIIEGPGGPGFGVPLSLIMSGTMENGTIEVELPEGLEGLWAGKD